jgi:hypothetical protein
MAVRYSIRRATSADVKPLELLILQMDAQSALEARFGPFRVLDLVHNSLFSLVAVSDTNEVKCPGDCGWCTHIRSHFP